jgi:nucleoid DNA-binding protein
MQELKRSDIDKLVALQSNKYQKDVIAVLDAYYIVLQEAILTGYKVPIPKIGYFSNSQVDPRPERMGYNIYTREPMLLPAQDAYNKPIFRFSKPLKDKMKEETLGKVL